MIDLSIVSGFEWDEGNLLKNWEKHRVTHVECEEAFFNLPLLLQPDVVHSHCEDRNYVLGQTNRGRGLFSAFTIRQDRIHIITARAMSRRERTIYAEATA